MVNAPNFTFIQSCATLNTRVVLYQYCINMYQSMQLQIKRAVFVLTDYPFLHKNYTNLSASFILIDVFFYSSYTFYVFEKVDAKPFLSKTQIIPSLLLFLHRISFFCVTLLVLQPSQNLHYSRHVKLHRSRTTQWCFVCLFPFACASCFLFLLLLFICFLPPP